MAAKLNKENGNMGDRANVVVKDGDEQVCLYSHCGGSELPNTLRAAMVRGKDRWNDASYLARIIFCEMVRGREMELTGFGISQTPPDGHNRVLTLDINEQTVQMTDRPAVPFKDFAANGANW